MTIHSVTLRMERQEPVVRTCKPLFRERHVRIIESNVHPSGILSAVQEYSGRIPNNVSVYSGKGRALFRPAESAASDLPPPSPPSLRRRNYDCHTIIKMLEDGDDLQTDDNDIATVVPLLDLLCGIESLHQVSGRLVRLRQLRGKVVGQLSESDVRGLVQGIVHTVANPFDPIEDPYRELLQDIIHSVPELIFTNKAPSGRWLVSHLFGYQETNLDEQPVVRQVFAPQNCVVAHATCTPACEIEIHDTYVIVSSRQSLDGTTVTFLCLDDSAEDNLEQRLARAVVEMRKGGATFQRCAVTWAEAAAKEGLPEILQETTVVLKRLVDGYFSSTATMIPATVTRQQSQMF